MYFGTKYPDDIVHIKRCSFDRDPENIPISEGDVINITTEKDYSEFSYGEIGITISYLFTFLLELDPL